MLLREAKISQAVKKFSAFMETDGSLPHSKLPSTCPYPEVISFYKV
jgi:hypothetical protein